MLELRVKLVITRACPDVLTRDDRVMTDTSKWVNSYNHYESTLYSIFI